MNGQWISVRVWGDFACFTRPEMKVERVSYEIMTPSAARGILEAIFWEPQMYYVIDSVRVVKKGRWVSFKRNEVRSVVSIDSARTWMRDPAKFAPIMAGGGAADGTQRNMLALEGVEYIITAEVRLSALGARAGQGLSKYTDEIGRRASQGKCFHRPCLGVREFAADFAWEDEPQAALARRATELGVDWREIWPDEDLGLMLYDVFDVNGRGEGFQWLPDGEAARFEGTLVIPSAAFFRAGVKKASMDCNPARVEILQAASEGR